MYSKTFREEIDISLNPQTYWLILKRRWLPAAGVFSCVSALAILFSFSQETTYQASGTVLVEPDQVATLTGLDQSGFDSLGKIEKVGVLADPLVTEVQIIQSVPIAEKTIADLKLKDETGKTLDQGAFLKDLKVSPVAGTDMIELTYSSEFPETATNVVNKLIENYIRDNIRVSRVKVEQARDFIEADLPLAEANVREAESALREFREANQVVELEEESIEAVRAMARLNDQLALAKSELAASRAQISALQNQLGMPTQSAWEAATLSQAPGIQTIFQQLQDLNGQLDIERSRYRSNHPNVIVLERQKANLQGRLSQEVVQLLGYSSDVASSDLQVGPLGQQLTADLVQAEVDQNILINQIDALSSYQSSQQARAYEYPRLKAIQSELERRQASAQSTYEALLKRLQEIKSAENQIVGNVRIISPARLPQQGTSSNKTTLIMGLAIAVFAALIVVTLLELVDYLGKSYSKENMMF